MKRRTRLILAAAAGMVALAALPGPARAANTNTFRDCSLGVGVDPDFVALPLVASNGTVAPSTNSVAVEASESSDPGDSAGHVTLTASVASAGLPTEKASGADVGKVVLSLPLLGSSTGRRYTISWSATFDNGGHACPSPLTVWNTSPTPFQVAVRG